MVMLNTWVVGASHDASAAGSAAGSAFDGETILSQRDEQARDDNSDNEERRRPQVGSADPAEHTTAGSAVHLCHLHVPHSTYTYRRMRIIVCQPVSTFGISRPWGVVLRIHDTSCTSCGNNDCMLRLCSFFPAMAEHTA